MQPLPRYLFAAYALLIVYASLHPMSDWRAHGGSPLAFAIAWPRWITGFDLAVNVAGYLPFGALAAVVAAPRVGPRSAIALATALGALLALVLEAVQSYLPARVPSVVDLLTNSLGTLLGAVLAVSIASRLEQGWNLARLRTRVLEPGRATDLGLTLLALWLFAQLSPATLLFGTGDLRDWLSVPGGPAYGPELFVTVETIITAANLLAVALIGSAMLAPGAPARRLVIALLAAALAVRALAFAVLVRPENAFAWLTVGAQRGLACGLALAVVAIALPRVLRLALAAVLLMAASVLVNLAPPNPYTAATLKVWMQGHFLNFNGLTQFVANLWPFAALLHLIALAARRGDD